MLDPKLVEILACPADKGPLIYLQAESLLFNPRLGLKYKIVDDIPVLTVAESEEVSEVEANRLKALAE